MKLEIAEILKNLKKINKTIETAIKIVNHE